MRGPTCAREQHKKRVPALCCASEGGLQGGMRRVAGAVRPPVQDVQASRGHALLEHWHRGQPLPARSPGAGGAGRSDSRLCDAAQAPGEGAARSSSWGGSQGHVGANGAEASRCVPGCAAAEQARVHSRKNEETVPSIPPLPASLALMWVLENDDLPGEFEGHRRQGRAQAHGVGPPAEGPEPQQLHSGDRAGARGDGGSGWRASNGAAAVSIGRLVATVSCCTGTKRVNWPLQAAHSQRSQSRLFRRSD